jgi:hypothetical protein
MSYEQWRAMLARAWPDVPARTLDLAAQLTWPLLDGKDT